MSVWSTTQCNPTRGPTNCRFTHEGCTEMNLTSWWKHSFWEWVSPLFVNHVCLFECICKCVPIFIYCRILKYCPKSKNNLFTEIILYLYRVKVYSWMHFSFPRCFVFNLHSTSNRLLGFLSISNGWSGPAVELFRCLLTVNMGAQCLEAICICSFVFEYMSKSPLTSFPFLPSLSPPSCLCPFFRRR